MAEGTTPVWLQSLRCSQPAGEVLLKDEQIFDTD